MEIFTFSFCSSRRIHKLVRHSHSISRHSRVLSLLAMYINEYKNSFFVDILEFCNIVKIEEKLPDAVEVERLSINESKNIFSKHDITNSDVEKTEDGSIAESEDPFDPFFVQWNGDDDPDNPQNWSNFKKVLIMIEIMLLTCITYMGASIYSIGQSSIQETFGVGQVVATLNLSLYALGYGIGPVIFSPFSEVAMVGRQVIYTLTFFVFTMFQIGAATVQNIGGLIVLRFLTGIVCSPALATGGATVGDIITPKNLPLCLSIWDLGPTFAPIIGPLLGASMMVAKNWRWIFWFMTWISGFTLITMIFLFPETSPDNILYRRAKRLRKQTGDNRYYTKQERIDSQIKISDFLVRTLYKPFKIIVQEPIVLVFNIYLSLAYGAFYLFFEAFPLVFNGIYNFSPIETGLSYMGFAVGSLICFPLLYLFLTKVLNPRIENNTATPETFLILAMWVGWALPASLFIFGWGAGVHWMLPIASEVLFQLCVWSLFQVTFTYLGSCYPRHMASVYAGNGLFRAVFACSFPLFATAMYNNLGSEKYPVGWGSSIIGFFSIALAFVPFVLYKYGAVLRSKSKYSG
ncbi:hypothetical protein KAFR_0D05140 [Kazachstania africana CBS 2517]|uniref:Major facilitator superfamily (MFS) profile domain-containing protein n=1 Tax=Kazachstania africana (strain ATCC 22294 / BCRC 22015 / CBS 2517 / CECT 1963 / NBRC 1671 / NRRL Y-8276) TaxID=1071382 RepID=H2AUW1_KAZAF|nr:hypothetical protein KAFR_0D05140 [Kazachstania africana CBS 2517]CCF58161.1 hypothetical protein KAFR_0D05140 [Kazachstania africana CBS 2517]